MKIQIVVGYPEYEHMGGGMNFETESVANYHIIYVHEERLDAHNSDELKKEMNRLFLEGANNLIVELKEVRFIDSSGLGALVSGFKNASSRHGSLKISGLQAQVRSMFELTRLHRVFDIYTTIDEALKN